MNNKELLYDSFALTQLQNNALYNYSLKNYCKLSPNIASLFIHGKTINTFKSCHTNTCNTVNCTTCEFVNSNNYIFLKNGLFIPIMSNCNCESSNLIYIISCRFCNMFYIGQTSKSARVRLNQHLYAIKKFIPFLHLTNEVGLHFNLRYHNYKDHFRFFIFKDNVKLLEDRLSIEKDLINLFIHFNPPLINSRIPSTFNIKNLAFS